MLLNSAGYYAISAQHSIKVLDVAATSTANGANVQQITSYNYLNQQWTISLAGCPQSTDINETEANNKVVIYPNPSKGALNILFKEGQQEDVSIEITNVIGEVIYRKTHSVNGKQTTESIDTRDFSEGLYLINIIYPDNHRYSKPWTLTR